MTRHAISLCHATYTSILVR